MKARRLFVAALLAAISVSGCGGGGSDSGGGGNTPPPPPAGVTYSASSGVVQKGPLILGSTVTAQELNASLVPTGKQYTYQTNSDFGTFNPNSTFTSQYIGVTATGYYFDEVTGVVSAGPIALNGYADLSSVSVLNVNILTTLAYQRIQKLVANSSMTFAAAQSQAEREVLTALNISAPGSSGHFGTLDISKGTDGDKLLAAISSIFAYGNSSANLAVLLANIQSDIGTNGRITSAASVATLAASAQALNPGAVATNLNQRYASSGLAFTAADISRWIDQDGAGLVGQYKFQVPDASSSSVFTFPSFVTDPYAGTSVSVSVGQLSVNGTPHSGPVQIQAGDIVAVSPTSGSFPAGVLNSYLLSGTTKIARASFVSGLQSLVVTPTDSSLAVGLTQPFLAAGTFTDGRTVNLTSSVTWTSSAPATAAISETGAVTANAVGAATITASSGSVSASTTLNVIGATLQSISLSPGSLEIAPGVTRQLTATGHYSDGSAGDLTATALWSTGSTAVGTVTGGLVTGVALGSTTVTAAAATISGSATVNVAANYWTAATGEAPRPGHTATLLPNGKVLVALGAGPSGQGLLSSSLYNPLTDTWSITFIDPRQHRHHTATLLASGKVLVAGGDDLGFHAGSSDIYDPVANVWSPGPATAGARAGHKAVLLPDGTVLIVGGAGSTGIYVHASAERYDPVANSWSSAGTMANKRQSLTATLLPNGRVLVAGGHTGTGVAPVSTEIYDPASNSWSPGASMITARSGALSVLLPNGKVLVVGGSSSTDRLASAEIYDPIANSWSQAASMAVPRNSTGTLTVLPDGKVLVVGGNSFPQIPTTAELYDPVADSWSSAPNPLSVHIEHSAILLPDGAVLVVSGQTGTAELFR